MNIFPIENIIHRWRDGKYGMQSYIKIRFPAFLLGQDLSYRWLRWIIFINCASVSVCYSVKKLHSVLVFGASEYNVKGCGGSC